MYKITNVCELGQNYKISDGNGNVLKTIQIVPHTDILNAALGEYNEKFSSIDDYLQQSIKVMTGFENIDPNKILWYATEDEEIVLVEIIEFAVNNGYDKIILEHLSPTE